MTDQPDTETEPRKLAPLCFIDTETTGVHPDREVWEVAMIRRDYGGFAPTGQPARYRETEVQFYVEVDLSKADPFGLKVGGFYERHPAGQWQAGGLEAPLLRREADVQVSTGQEAANAVARMTHGSHLVGVVPSFDAEVLDRLLRRHGLLPGWHYHLVDVEAMAAGWLAADETTVAYAVPPWSSDDLSRRCGVAPPTEEDRHTALGDARWAKRWYDRLAGPRP